jgi:2-O-(6-phospho-alpha-D-mannosyl)-D-glycerate hydrolase
MPHPPHFDVHLVAHTHWDREWYLGAGRFRQRLVVLIDELLAEAPVAENAFLLDGQAIVVEDYLAVRPECRSALADRLRSRLLEAGPWYVLADELIPGGEALVRNLLAGRAVLRALGAEPPPVLYSPDAFGHPAALPAIARGFGCATVMLWRGFGGARRPAGDAFRWRAPDGTEALLYHLPRAGYEFGSGLPADERAARERWMRMRSELAPRARLGVLLVQNGADHHGRQPRFTAAADALARVAAPDKLVRSSLRTFATAVARRAERARLAEVTGELRDSYGYTWTLQGTFATRAHQKRRNAAVERLLTREAEPWSALARRRGLADRGPLLRAAWKTLLQCHPHDTLCGCSTDEVARAMDARLEDATTQAAGLRDDALHDLADYDPTAAREARDAWRPLVLVRNPAARPRGGLAVVRIDSFLADVPVGPGSAAVVDPPDPGAPSLDGGRIPLQVLHHRLRNDRLDFPRHYPDNDLVSSVTAIAWVPPLEGYGTLALSVGEASDAAVWPEPVRARAGRIENGRLRLEVDDAGAVALTDLATRRRVPSLLELEVVRDSGDLYTHSPVGVPVRAGVFGGARVVHGGPLRATLETRWRIPVTGPLRPLPPGQSDGAVPARSSDGEVELSVRFTLDAEAKFLRIRVRGVNGARDHRLRAVFATGLVGAEQYADAAFAVVPRAPIVVEPDEAAVELPPPTAPLHRYVSLFTPGAGATLFSDGLAEYQATAAGEIAVTLLRAVGQLSRNDLPERPGHAGWPVATPGAQCVGRFEAEFALLAHGPRSSDTLDTIARTADDVLLPLGGATLRSALAVPAPTSGVELRGRGLVVSAIKDSEDGEWLVLRCVNLTEDRVDGEWRLGIEIAKARLARLDETPLEALAVRADAIAFTAPPRAIVTILAR